MYATRWVRFVWNLNELPTFEAKMKSSLRLREALDETKEDLYECMEQAYSMDTSWSVGIKERLKKIERYVKEGINGEKLSYLILEDGSRPIGVAGLYKVAGDEPQIATGICITNEYRCRGLGTVLLHGSLKFLKDAGLEKASVITKDKTHAAKHLYTKFGSTIESLEGEYC
jgi:ribosomal protein S18 acetylase RimI-like enzyme